MGSAYALLASLMWGCSDFLGAFQSRSQRVWVVMIGSQAIGIIPLALLAVLRPPAWPPVAEVSFAMLAGLMSLLGVAGLYAAMARGGMVLIAPIASGAAVVPVLWSLATGHLLDARQWLGVVLALAGSTAAAMLSPHSSRVDGKPARRRGIYLLCLASSVFTGAFFILLEHGSVTSPVLAEMNARIAAALGAGAIALATLKRDRPAGRRAPLGTKAWLLLGLTGILDALAGVSFAAATAHQTGGLAAVLSSLYPAVTVVLGFLILHEKVRPKAIAGLVVAVVGAGLLV